MPIVNGYYRRPQLRNSGINYRHGWFFVTTQVAQNKSVFGAIVGDKCVLNRLGETVASLLATLPKYNPEVHVDAFVVMPNHVHLLLKIDDAPGNDVNHLGKIMRKYKSLAAHEYLRLAREGGVPGIGPHLWQENYWEKLVASHGQLDAIRRYIAENPGNWTLDRFGPVTTHAIGNLDLLNEPFVAFVASQMPAGEAVAPRLHWGATAPGADNVVISTFTSPQEREILWRLLEKKRRFIALYPGGIPERPAPQIAAAVEDGRALLLSPVPSGTGVNKQRAIWCNEYALRRADAIWCGGISPGGTLDSLLRGLGR